MLQFILDIYNYDLDQWTSISFDLQTILTHIIIILTLLFR